MNALSEFCKDCRRQGNAFDCSVCKGEPMLFTPLRCKYCGGRLSEIRTNGKVPYRHCFSCHFEFPEEENNDKDTGPQDKTGAV